MLKKIRLLAEEPRPDGTLKLKGMGAEYRIRIGDYRLRYKIDDENQVVILGPISVSQKCLRLTPELP